jgi:hypothetical protein
MAFLTRDALKAVTARATASQKFAAKNQLSAKTAAARGKVFLSHSHSDADLVEPFLLKLFEEGVVVYVDWKDPTMPSVTNPDTAKVLKDRIKQCGKFILLATNNALESRWVPWELGIADLQNGMSNVAVLPIQDSGTSWKGNEYIGIYSRVEPAHNGRLAVFEPGKQEGVYLSDWVIR